MMRVWGVWLIAIGAIWLVIAFNMDTSVVSYGGMYGAPSRVENIGLIAQRQNHLMVASLITLIGTLMTIFGGGGASERASSAEIPNAQVADSPPCKRDLSLDAYRLWLAAKYDIKKNQVFDGFVYEEKIFNSLEEALRVAHDQEEKLLAELEIKILEEKKEEAERAEFLKAELERQDKNSKKFGFIFIIILIIFATIFSYSAIKKSRENNIEIGKRF